MAASNNNATTQCAACGKGGDELKACTACKLVKYCGVDCERSHCPQHKISWECTKRAAELHDEALFKQPPGRDECPICFLDLPIRDDQMMYKACCGKTICQGCDYASVVQSDNNSCPFCRKPAARSLDEARKRIERRVELKDAEAIGMIGKYYLNGELGLQQDHQKGLELLQNAVELGSIEAHYNLGCEYYHGKNGVEVDKKKANYYWGVAAIAGHVLARHNLGSMEGRDGNHHRAMKHVMISASTGCDISLKEVQDGYRCGIVSKDDFEKTLRAHQKSKDEMKSEWRDKTKAMKDQQRIWTR